MQDNKYNYGRGRRKTATARVRLYEGHGVSTVNGKEIELTPTLKEIFHTIGKDGQFYLSAHVVGGGKQSQQEAIRHGIARALVALSADYRSVLRVGGYLTRDSRMKERKKPGLKRARRAPQWAKR